MPERFGSIYSILSRRDYMRLKDIIEEYPTDTLTSDYSDPFVLDNLTPQQILNVVDLYRKGVQEEIESNTRNIGKEAAGDSEFLQYIRDMRQISADLDSIRGRLIKKIRR